MLSRLLRALLPAVLLAAALLVVFPPVVLAHGKMHCDLVDGNTSVPDSAVGVAPVDPIVQPGVNPAAHEHEFWGNSTLLTLPNQGASATYAELTAGGTACVNPADTAAYWAPSLWQLGGDGIYRPVPSARFIAYYRAWNGNDTGPGNLAHPADTRLVIGNGAATAPQPTARINWGCNVNSSRNGPYVDAVQSACHTATGTVLLRVHAISPPCWDGFSASHLGPGNTADYTGASEDGITDHYAYTVSGRCPAGFPNKTPRLTLTWWYDYQGDGTDLYLSSKAGPDGIFGTLDDLPDTAQQSQWRMHSDFWNTWQQAGLSTMISRCVNTTTAHPHGSSAVCGS